MSKTFLVKYSKYRVKTEHDERRVLYDMLIGLIGTNIQIVIALERLYKIKSSKKNADIHHHKMSFLTPFLNAIYIWYIDLTKSGGEFSDVIKSWIPENEYFMLSTGKSTAIVRPLEKIIKSSENISEIKSQAAKKLAYPCFIAVSAIGVLFAVARILIPQLTKANGNVAINWIGLAQDIINVSDFLEVALMPIIFGIIVILIATYFVMIYYNGEARKYLDKIPPFSIYRTWVGVEFLNGFASLISETTQKMALAKIRTVASPYLRFKIDLILSQMDEGKDFGNALVNIGADFPSKVATNLILAYEETGGLSKRIDEITLSLNKHQTQSLIKDIGVFANIVYASSAAAILWVSMCFFDVINQIIQTQM